MLAQVSRAARRAHVDSMRALLAAERDALGDIARIAIGTVAGFLMGPGDAVAVGHRLEMAALPAIVTARRRGRSASVDGMREEWQVVRAEAPREGVDPFSIPLVLPREDGADEISAAGLAAKEIGDAFVKRATAAVEKADGRSVSGRSVLPVSAIEEKAATQTAEAFNDERARAERLLVQRYSGTDWLPAIGKMWDATIDRRTCRICAGNDGQIRPLGVSFTAGVRPASVHRRCRCVQVFIFAPLYMGREERDAA